MRLTRRELTIIVLIGSGHSALEIAQRLDISPRTVANHKRRLYAKLGVGCQSQAVLRGIALGLFDPSAPPTPPVCVPTPDAESRRLDTRGDPEPRSPRPPATPPTGREVRLTSREGDVLKLIARGFTIRQTARALGIAAKTVENTQARLFRKLGARNRSETLTIAYRLGLIHGATSSDLARDGSSG